MKFVPVTKLEKKKNKQTNKQSPKRLTISSCQQIVTT